MSKQNESSQEQRSLTGAIVTGLAAGTGSAVAQQGLAKLGSLGKPKPEPKK
jgi:hypothetical protein